mmetsp:Transcript_38197/g.114258  ORF Transcript_38197/g.114258 Transcript_38197/m.114258 type:complete len:204 (+) Transcript_38197:1316-1927(+)
MALDFPTGTRVGNCEGNTAALPHALCTLKFFLPSVFVLGRGLMPVLVFLGILCGILLCLPFPFFVVGIGISASVVVARRHLCSLIDNRGSDGGRVCIASVTNSVVAACLGLGICFGFGAHHLCLHLRFGPRLSLRFGLRPQMRSSLRLRIYISFLLGLSPPLRPSYLQRPLYLFPLFSPLTLKTQLEPNPLFCLPRGPLRCLP